MTRQSGDYPRFFPSGSAVTLEGEWDVRDVAVVVDDAAVPARVVDSRKLEFTMPAGLAAGYHAIAVRSGGRNSNRLSFIVP